MDGGLAAVLKSRERPTKSLRMLAKGRRFAKHLPGYRILGVDPGYLFVSANGPSIDLPEQVVDYLLKELEGVQ